MPSRRPATRHLVRTEPLGYSDLDALERELVDDLIAAIASSKRRHRPDYGSPSPERVGAGLSQLPFPPNNTP